VAFSWYVIDHISALKELAHTLQQGMWQWIVAAAVVQVIYYLALSATYQSALATVGVPSKLQSLVPFTLGAVFANTVVPAGGAAGAALYVDDAGRRGYSRTQASMGVLLQIATDFGSFCLILIVGMIWLAREHALRWYELGAAIILVVYVGGMAALLVIGLFHPVWLHSRFRDLQYWVNRLGGWVRRPHLLSDQWSTEQADELIGASHAIARKPFGVFLTTAIGLAAHLVNLASLYCLFMAFRQPVSLGTLIAGYSMCILFSIVSPTSNGVGIVEALMPVVLISLGIPAAAAAVVSLSFRGLTVWIPLFLGFILLHRLKLFARPERDMAEIGEAQIAAWLTALMGIINVLSGVTPNLVERLPWLQEISPLAVRRGGHLTSVLAGFALLVLARGLKNHKRAAWVLTEMVLIVSVVAHLVKGLDYEEAIIAGLLALYLWIQRDHFHALSDPPSLRQGLVTLVTAIFFTLGYGIIGFYLLDRHFSVNFSMRAAIVQTIVMFTQFYDPGLQPITGFGRYFAASIYTVGAVTIGYALWMLLRPVLLRKGADRAQRQRAQAIVETYGHSSLAAFTLFPDKVYWFSPGGSVIAYAVQRGMAVALGDPIGPAEDVEAAIAGFQEFCRHNDWQASFYQTAPDGLSLYKQCGFETLCIGHEGIIDLASFTINGGVNKTLRNAVNRLTKAGYEARFYAPPLSPWLLAELRLVSDEWLGERNGRERGFSLGWFDDDYIRSATVIAVHAGDGTIVAFANLVSEYKRNEVCIDLMRHRRDTENGTMDFLIVKLIEWVRTQGHATFNLGLSALSGVGDERDDPAVERALHYIYEHVYGFYNFKGIFEFKEKFHPQWSPRYLVIPNYASLPAVVYTMEAVSTGEFFLFHYLRDWYARVRQRQTLPPPQVNLNQAPPS
jgi:phosphatidylglycerol lysyltransferase